MEPPKPTRIGAYDIVDVIGRGGMGTVFRGNDPRIGRAVAIKVLTAAAEDPDLLIRFYREAKYTGSLHHQNIVTVYELGHQNGVPYLVMEYLEGVTLETMISSGRPMPVAEKLGIILQVCSGLTYAHKQGLVHRDIKPANIMILPDGTAKIVDFGIALLGGSQLTRTGHVVGSLNYMSPEQLSGNVEVDVRTDVYSTGVVLFQLLTGRLPFDGGSTAATLRMIVQDPPPPLGKYLQDCPEELEGILQKAMVKDREERYASPEDFALDLARVHHQYLTRTVGDTLHAAAEALRRKDFTAARQHVLLVLRGAPQNAEAAELLKQIKQGQERAQHEQQMLTWQMKAEEAFRKNHLEEALQHVEQGMRLDPGNAVFVGLRDAIMEAQTRMGLYREALKRAEAALRAGDLEAAKQSVEDAQAILPDDPGARTLAGQIITKLEQKLREQRAVEKQREFARSLNAAEKGMADARMLLLMGQAADAQQVLENMENEISELPPQWIDQFKSLKGEVREKKAEIERAAPPKWTGDHDGQTAEIPAQFNATRMMEPVDTQPGARGDTGSMPSASVPAETTRFAPSTTAHDALYPRGESRGRSVGVEVAPELREFLEPASSTWSRPTVWLGVAVLVLVGVFVWLILRPSAESPAHPTQTIASYSYAEINAEPWATVIAVSPASGDAQSIVGQTTPLRVKLSPGQYSVTLRGPNREEKRVDVTVPASGGVTCFAVFKKPDLSRIVGRQ
jgi:tetratricopeptide (TPR) repeat protein